MKRACGFEFAGVISLSRSVFGKANSVIPMVISAQDGGGLVSLTNARVNISVVAGLVAPPVFEHPHYYFSIAEDVLRGTVVGIIQASVKTGVMLTLFSFAYTVYGPTVHNIHISFLFPANNRHRASIRTECSNNINHKFHFPTLFMYSRYR